MKMGNVVIRTPFVKAVTVVDVQDLVEAEQEVLRYLDEPGDGQGPFRIVAEETGKVVLIPADLMRASVFEFVERSATQMP